MRRLFNRTVDGVKHMNVALGLKAHSGWAALVVVGKSDDRFVVVERKRLELVEEQWAKQPYHAAENMEAAAARNLVRRGVSAAHKIASRELKAAIAHEVKRKNTILACAVLMSSPMPAWTVDEILAVHFRMHKAEGVLFREALLAAANNCGLPTLALPEKSLSSEITDRIETTRIINALGKSVGPPWAKDQKDAALAAIIALEKQGVA